MSSKPAAVRLSPKARWAIALLAVAAIVPPQVEADASEIPELAGVTTIQGTAPGSALVRVPAAAGISGAIVENEDISVSGSGRFIGVVLVTEEAEDRIGPTLIAGRIDPQAICDETGCPFGVATPFASVDLDRDQNGELSVPPGLYRLHLIREETGEPVSVTLRFSGLGGEARLTPGEPTGLKTMPLPPRVPLPQSQSVYWNGGAHDMGANNRGLMWSMVWLRHPIEPQASYHYCIYAGGEPEDAPGCPTADIQLAINTGLVGVPVKAWVLLEGYGFPAQGTFGQKLWFASHLTDGVDGIALWLPFGEVSSPLSSLGGALSATIFPVLIGGEGPASPVTVRKTECALGPCPDRLTPSAGR